MKLKSLLLLVFFAVTYSFPQVVVSVPPYPIETDSIRIIFDASQGGQGLMGYTGTVYAHTGVYTNLSPTSWAYVIGSWGNNTTQPALTRLGTNLYQLVIGKPRTFYNISNAAEHIKTLNFVFRSADGTRQTEDIHMQIYSSGLHMVIDSPLVSNSFGDPQRSPAFANPNDSINVSITGVTVNTVIQSIKLYVNNTLIQTGSSNNLQWKFIANNYPTGPVSIVAVGKDTSGISDTAKFVIMNNPVVTNQAPPAGTELGINYNSNTNVTLAFFGPYKKFAYLLSNLSDWKVDQNYFMKKYQVTADSVIWWINLNIIPSTEYTFQYLVDGNIRIADPYCDKVLDPWNDQYITSTVYPNLIPYPSGKTENIAGTFQTAQTPYNWQVTNFTRPAKTDLVVYELLVRDFIGAHTYTTLADTLNYLKNLGINAIELMPVMEFEGNESWGYNVSFHNALDKYYGTKNAFKAFIDKCHQNGIAVILDIAFNHAFGLNPLVRLYWDAANNRPAANNPWFNPIAKHDFNVGYDMNHESNATRYYVDKVLKHWIQEFHIDGYRFDLSKGFTQTNTLGNTTNWGHYDQSRINNLKRIADKIRAYDPNSYLILEHFADNDEETVLAAYNFMLWGNLNARYNEATMGWTDNSNSDISWGSYQARSWNNPALVTYMESHDEERLMFKNITYGNSSGGYNVKNLSTAIDREKLAGAFFFTIPGPKMMWQFGELAYDYSIDYNGRVGNKPIRWDYYSDIKRNKLYKVYSYLINLKKNYDAFRTTNYALDVAGGTKRINLYNTEMDVTITGNFSVNSGTVNPNFSRTGKWYDYFSGDSITVSNTTAQLPILPGEFHIYTTKRLPVPEQGILSAVQEDNNSDITVKEYSLEQNYPNPFNPSTVIRFALPKAGNVNLSVYNVLGQKVAEILNKDMSSGIHTVSFNAGNLTSGIYFYRLESNGYTQSRKMMLIK